jgi:iron complex outermembrane receptor protein
MMRFGNGQVTQLVTGTILMLGAATPGIAQEIGAAQDISEPEIVVTAAKRTERLQDVPIAVSVVGGEVLARSRVTTSDDLVTKIPNLQLTSTVGDNTSPCRTSA